MKYFNLFILVFLSGCSGYEPAASVAQTGEGTYQNPGVEINLNEKIIDICSRRNCSKINVRPNLSNMDINTDLYITNIDHLHINKYTNGSARISFSQKEMTKPSIKTILVLRDLKELGFDLKYIGGEKWHCGDKPLKRRYCRQEKIQGQGQDFLGYIVADNQMQFSYKDGDAVVPL